MMTAAEFNKARAVFMRRASAPELPANALKLAYIIAYKEMDCKLQSIYRRQETLAAALKMTVRGVQKLLAILRPLGLMIEGGHGPNQASVYRIAAPAVPEKANSSSPIREKANSSSPIAPSKRRTGSARKGELGVHEKANSSSPLLNKNLQEESLNGRKSASHARAKPSDSASLVASKQEPPREDSAIADGFARFWSSYPRKINEDGARRAFGKAIAGGADIEAVVARAAVYALERDEAIRSGDLPKWTLHPENWLKKRMFNEPMPPGIVIDQAGHVVALPQHQQQRKRSGFTALADELCEEIEREGGGWRHE